MARKRRALDWVVRPEAWSTAAEFIASATQWAWIPLTVWQASMSSTGQMPEQATGLFEPGAALTVERIRGEAFILIDRLGNPDRWWQHTFRIRVGEEEMFDTVSIGQPVQPTTYDVNSPEWANEDFLWEHRDVISTGLSAVERFTQPTVRRIPIDVRSRRRLEPPDQLQLVI